MLKVETETLTVDLAVELAAQVRDAVERGEFASSNEAISAAIFDWSTHREIDVDATEGMRRAWQEAIDDPRPTVPMEEVMDRLAAKYRALATEPTGTR